MLWRRALSEGDHSPEELMLQRRLAKKRGEILEESQQASSSSTELLPPLDFKQAEISNSPDSTPLNSSKIQLSSKGSSLKTSPSPQNQTHRQQRNHHEHGHELGHHNENGHHSEHELPPLGQLKTDVTMSPSQATTYFGAPARDQFFQRYQWLSRQHSLQSSPNKSKNDEKSAPIMFDDPQNSVENEFKSHVEYKLRPVTPDVINLTKGFGLSSPTSPRSKYIYECIMSHINPRPSLLIRKKISNELRLEHYGMGDSMAIRLSTVLADLPMVTVLNFADNHLTDVGLTPLINRIVVMPNLVELNLSENAIGPLAAEALGKYLSRRPTIPLRRLLLSKSNVDDFEGEKFVRALVGNSTIVELDLSHNLLGHAELLNVVRPNFITAAEAMAQLLRSDTCRLEQLKLSWNMIRLESAIQLSQSLSSNQSLTYLDLSYNGIGQDGGLAIGNSLLENRTLETLLLANNNINASACFTIAIGLEMNLALRRVCLDGNPIADQGAQALMNVPAAVGSRTEISAQGCNIEILDESCWFDQKNPCGSFSLNLSNPFERAISFKILNIVANHATYTLKKCVYEEMPSKKQRKKKTHVINLSQGVVQDKIRHLNAAERDVIKNLHKLKESANNHERALSLFRQYDKDGSGEIDKNELAALLEDIGIELSNKQLEDVFALYDIDNGGTIEMDEFSHFLQQQSLEASSRIRDLTESLVMVVDTGDEDDDENEIQPYYPPKTGTLKLEVVDSYTKKNRYRVISSSETHMATAVAKKIGNLAILLPYSFQHVKLRLEEAYTAYISMYGETGDKFSVLTKILPQMSSPAEARILLSKVTNDDQSEIRRLRFGLRSFRRPAFGLENGYYNLDLSLSIDRICLSKLLELSKSFHLQRSSSSWNETSLRFGDTSQENNNSCFRNERLNGAPVKISPDSFTPIPKNGRLEFDFSSISQPESGICLSDTKCLKLLVLMGLIPSNQKGRNKKRLENWSKNNNFERIIGLTSSLFYSNLTNRNEEYRKSFPREEIRVNYLVNEATIPSEIISADAPNPVEDEPDKNETAPAGKRGRQLKYWKNFQTLMASGDVSNEAKSSRVVDQLEVSLGAMWIRSRHLALLLDNFSIGAVDKCLGFGSYRVDLVVSFFTHLVDRENFELVLNMLTPQEIGCVYCRLGWLNIFNPLRPEGVYELSLSSWEERQVVKCILILAMAEPGDNITKGSFRWQREMESMPGWTVTVPWLTEEGMPKKGIVNFIYTSKIPNFVARRALLTQVLSSEPQEDLSSPRDCKEEIDFIGNWQQFLQPAKTTVTATATEN